MTNEIKTWLNALSRYKLATLQQLSALTTGQIPDVQLLVKEKVLLQQTVPKLDGSMQHVFSLARKGAEILSQESGVEVSRFQYLTPARMSKSLFTIEHALAITQVGIALDLLKQTVQGFDVPVWETSPQKIGASVRSATSKGLQRIPLVADAYFSLSFQNENPYFVLELDRGTIDLARMRTKFQGYLSWWRSGGPKERFGVRNLRLLVLVPNEKRRQNLISAVRSVAQNGGAGFFWFALQNCVEEPITFLQSVWQKADDNDSIPLFSKRPGLRAQP